MICSWLKALNLRYWTSRQRRTRERPLFVIIGQFPPPVSGASQITDAFADNCSGFAEVIRIDVKADVSRSGFQYVWQRVYCGFAGLFDLLRYMGERVITVHCFIDDGWGALVSLPSLAAVRCRGWKIFIHHHSFRYISVWGGHAALVHLLSGRSAIHVFLCKRQEAGYKALYGATRSKVVGNAWAVVGPQRMPSPHDGDKTVHIGLLSNLTIDKGVEIFLHVLASCIQQGMPVHGHLAGPLVESAAKRIVADATSVLGNRLTVHGPIYGEAKWDFYDSLDCFVFPTRHASEAQPLVLFEAMASGCAIVSYDRGCIGDDIQSAGYSVRTTEDFVHAAAARISYWCNHPKELVLLQSTARSLFLNARARSTQLLLDTTLDLDDSMG